MITLYDCNGGVCRQIDLATVYRKMHIVCVDRICDPRRSWHKQVDNSDMPVSRNYRTRQFESKFKLGSVVIGWGRPNIAVTGGKLKPGSWSEHKIERF